MDVYLIVVPIVPTVSIVLKKIFSTHRVFPLPNPD